MGGTPKQPQHKPRALPHVQDEGELTDLLNVEFIFGEDSVELRHVEDYEVWSCCSRPINAPGCT